MISKLAHLAIEANEGPLFDTAIVHFISDEELVELDAELRDNPMLANPMLSGFAWNVNANTPFVLVFSLENGATVTVYCVNQSLPGDLVKSHQPA